MSIRKGCGSRRGRSVRRRSAKAACSLGLRHFRGDGVTQDGCQASARMRAAAEHGNLRVQNALGAFYLIGFEENGSGAREGDRWRSSAAGRGDMESKKLLKQAPRGQARMKMITDDARQGVTFSPATGIRAIRTSASGDSRTGIGIDRVPASAGRSQETNSSRALPEWLDAVRANGGGARKSKTKIRRK